MANIKLAYASAISLTVTGLSSLANNAAATSDEIDNTATLNADDLVEVSFTTTTLGTGPVVSVYALSSLDGTNYSSSDAKVLLGVIVPTASTTAYRSQGISVAAGFGGRLPPKYKIVVENKTGAAFSAGSAQRRPVYYTST